MMALPHGYVCALYPRPPNNCCKHGCLLSERLLESNGYLSENVFQKRLPTVGHVRIPIVESTHYQEKYNDGHEMVLRCIRTSLHFSLHLS